MRTLILTIALLGFPFPAFAQERDWTIERPVLAGFLSGLTLTTCRSCQLGMQGKAAGEHDPFSMAPVVRGELERLGRRPYRIAQIVGSACTLFVIGGIIFRRLNRLRPMESVR